MDILSINQTVDTSRKLRFAGRAKEAAELLQNFEKVYGPYEWISREIISCYAALGDFEMAAELAEQLSKDYPEHHLRYIQASAEYYLKHGLMIKNIDFEKRTKSYRKALDLYRSHSIQASKAVTFLMKSLEDPKFASTIVFYPGKKLSKIFEIMHRTGKALPALNSSKSKIGIQEILASIERNLQKIAGTDIETSRQNLLLGEIRSKLGMLRKMKRSDLALEICDRIQALGRDPNGVNAIMAATCAADLGDKTRTIFYCDLGLRQNLKNESLIILKIEALIRSRLGPEAHSVAKQAYQSVPDFPRIAATYAIGLCIRGETEATRSVIAPFLERISQHGILHVTGAMNFLALSLAISECEISELTNLFQNKAQGKRILELSEDFRFRNKRAVESQGNRKTLSIKKFFTDQDEDRYYRALSVSGLYERIETSSGALTRDTARATGIHALPDPRTSLWKPKGKG